MGPTTGKTTYAKTDKSIVDINNDFSFKIFFVFDDNFVSSIFLFISPQTSVFISNLFAILSM